MKQGLHSTTKAIQEQPNGGTFGAAKLLLILSSSLLVARAAAGVLLRTVAKANMSTMRLLGCSKAGPSPP